LPVPAAALALTSQRDSVDAAIAALLQAEDEPPDDSRPASTASIVERVTVAILDAGLLAAAAGWIARAWARRTARRKLHRPPTPVYRGPTRACSGLITVGYRVLAGRPRAAARRGLFTR
jgi:hypothetical protein